jgi:hypothetical protein
MSAERGGPIPPSTGPPTHGDGIGELRSVRLIEALAAIWTKIREHHPDVPGVVLIAAPSTHRRMNVLGHFSALRWRGRGDKGDQLHEVVVVAEHLDRTPEDVCETLIHEAAHALNFARGIKDCSASQYHNKKFRDAAETLGLDVTKVPHYGYSLTKLLPATTTHYEQEISNLRSVLIHRRRPLLTVPPNGPEAEDDDSAPPDDEGPSRSRSLKATCACPFIIRVSRKTLSETTIRCESCGEAFGLA